MSKDFFNLNQANNLWRIYQLIFPYSAKANLDKIPDLNDYL